MAAEHDRRTWPWFRDLAAGCPEAGVWFQGRTFSVLILRFSACSVFVFTASSVLPEFSLSSPRA